MHAPHEYQWTAGADPVNALWPLTPALLEDEVISSWLVRCALAHDCEPTTLTGDVWPGVRVWCADIDRELSSGQLAALHTRSGLTVRSLEASTLVRFWGQMTGAKHFPHGIAPWILCLGVRNRRRCGGLQYCPLCFDTLQPHYLLQGRLAWHTVCPIHHAGLLDHCEQCNAPLCPHLLVPPELDLCHCHRCGFELKRATPGPVLETALQFQDATDSLFSGPPLLYGHAHLPLVEWLALAKWMLGTLRNGVRGRASCTDAFFKTLGVSFENASPLGTGLPFEYLAPGERADLLSNVWIMIQAGPDRLIRAARDEGVSPSLLLSRGSKLPETLAELTSVIHSRWQRHVSETHTEKPRLPKSVLIQWHRLLRKFQR